MASAHTPDSTYRLQFNKSFTFAHATAIADYLHELGIGDCYASSYLAAVPGSGHGYDVADPSRLNPEIGTEKEYWAWIDTLRGFGMGHVLDVVPNHMGIAKSANPLWQDVLENGPSSRYAHFFDIDWHPVKDELADKVLIPILGDQYGAALESQELRLAFDQHSFVVRCYDNILPVAPDTFSSILGGSHLETWLESHSGADAEELQSILTASRNLPSRSSRNPEDITTRAREKEVIKRRLGALVASSPDVSCLIEATVDRLNGVSGQPRSFDELDRLLNEQSYRLAHWRVASEEINYRRFFDVNELAALRMEDPAVFEEVHRFVLDLVQKGAPTGLRIDHVDGLFDPAEYLRRLQARCGRGFYIVVEKILGTGERLPEDWPVAGSTGYEFAAVVNNLFVDRRNERAFDDIATRFVRERRSPQTFQDLAYRCRKQVMHETMSGDINSLGHRLNLFSERNRHFRDFTLYSLISTLKEAIACFPVYRTYVTDAAPVRDQDRRYIGEAIASAKRRAPSIPALVFDFVERLLLKQTSVSAPEEAAERALFIGKFQQTTGPVVAKGIEDTALYLFPRLLSLNEVGADPTCFGLEVSVVHDWLLSRQQQCPGGLSATSTHDSKRSEDVRARLNVLSEIPGAWKPAVLKWRSLNRRFKSEVGGISAPDPNEEYLLYQTLIGAWPFDFAAGESRDRPSDDFVERLCAYMIKALRESKAHTSWINPNDRYERAVLRFVNAILDPRRAAAFLKTFLPLQARVAELGIYNSLAQLLIKITAPGVPDFYQGTELWDLRLVDPDNRRPVDYDARRRMLESIPQDGNDRALPRQLLESRRDGRIKMFVTARALAVRRRLRSVFAGEYVPLGTSGSRRDSLFAFARRSGAEWAVTCVPRLLASMVPDASGSSSPPLGGVWVDTRVELPAGASTCRDVFTGTRFDVDVDGSRPTLPAAAVFAQFPVALLVAD